MRALVSATSPLDSLPLVQTEVHASPELSFSESRDEGFLL